MIVGAVVHGEPLGPIQWASMLYCAAGVAFALRQPVRVESPRRSPWLRPVTRGEWLLIRVGRLTGRSRLAVTSTKSALQTA